MLLEYLKSFFEWVHRFWEFSNLWFLKSIYLENQLSGERSHFLIYDIDPLFCFGFVGDIWAVETVFVRSEKSCDWKTFANMCFTILKLEHWEFSSKRFLYYGGVFLFINRNGEIFDLHESSNNFNEVWELIITSWCFKLIKLLY